MPNPGDAPAGPTSRSPRPRTSRPDGIHSSPGVVGGQLIPHSLRLVAAQRCGCGSPVASACTSKCASVSAPDPRARGRAVVTDAVAVTRPVAHLAPPGAAGGADRTFRPSIPCCRTQRVLSTANKGDGWVHLVLAQAPDGSPCDCLASVGRFVLGSPSTTSSYELRTSSSTSSRVTASPARMVSQCRLFMWQPRTTSSYRCCGAWLRSSSHFGVTTGSPGGLVPTLAADVNALAGRTARF